jgi:dihydrofolate reductase
MIRCSVYVAVSLDGYIAGENDDLAWLNPPEGTPPGEDFGFKDFFASVDVVIMGRRTYAAVMGFENWPYPDKRVIVLAHQPFNIPPHLTANIERMSGEPGEIVDALEKQGVRHAYVDGGLTIQAFLEAGLIDEMTLTHIPMVLGGGVPLFGSTRHPIHLRHVETKHYSNGYVQTKYNLD